METDNAQIKNETYNIYNICNIIASTLFVKRWYISYLTIDAIKPNVNDI